MPEEGIFSEEVTFTELASGVLYNRGPSALEIRVVYRDNDHEERELQPFHVLRWTPEDTGSNPGKTMVVSPPVGTTYYFSGTPFIHGFPPSEPILAQILGQEVTLNVGVVAASATVDIDIVAQTIGDLTIDIAAQSVGNLNINIAASAVTIDIDIVAQTVGNLNIDIVAQTVGNLDIDIVAQTVGNLNINIAASAATVNIDVTTQTITLNIDIAEQTIAIRPEEIFETYAANDLNVQGAASIVSGTNTQILTHTVPVGETLDIYHAGASMADHDSGVTFEIRVAGVLRAVSAGRRGGFMVYGKPVRATASQVVTIFAEQLSGANRTVSAHFMGIEK